MADYNWFDNEPATDSDAKVWGDLNGFTVWQGDPQERAMNKTKRQLYPETVWCDWCCCGINPALWAMRQHRRTCTTDPRVAAKSEPRKTSWKI